MINTVVLQGRLTDHPDLITTSGGDFLCKFTIANETGYGEKKRTNFINCIAWKKNAEFIKKHFAKGDNIGITGELTQNKYTTKEGESRSTYEVQVREAHFMGAPRREEAAPAVETPTFSSENAPHFEEIRDDEDLPF